MGREDQGVAVSHHRHQVIPRTLCFITHGEEVLLLLGGAKKRLWAGHYNGLGGHVEPDEDIYTSDHREVNEKVRAGGARRPAALCGARRRRRPTHGYPILRVYRDGRRQKRATFRRGCAGVVACRRLACGPPGGRSAGVAAEDPGHGPGRPAAVRCVQLRCRRQIGDPIRRASLKRNRAI